MIDILLNIFVEIIYIEKAIIKKQKFYYIKTKKLKSI